MGSGVLYLILRILRRLFYCVISNRKTVCEPRFAEIFPRPEEPGTLFYDERSQWLPVSASAVAAASAMVSAAAMTAAAAAPATAAETAPKRPKEEREHISTSLSLVLI